MQTMHLTEVAAAGHGCWGVKRRTSKDGARRERRRRKWESERERA